MVVKLKREKVSSTDPEGWGRGRLVKGGSGFGDFPVNRVRFLDGDTTKRDSDRLMSTLTRVLSDDNLAEHEGDSGKLVSTLSKVLSDEVRFVSAFPKSGSEIVSCCSLPKRFLCAPYRLHQKLLLLQFRLLRSQNWP